MGALPLARLLIAPVRRLVDGVSIFSPGEEEVKVATPR
jgi:hypothetical protein